MISTAGKLADISSEELVMYFEFLDVLRESGKTNMFGASPYLAREYDITLPKARVVLSAWQSTFNEVLPAEDRAMNAFEAA